MARYFLEVAYKGTRYSGFQVQENAPTIQAEIEKACKIVCGFSITLTGSSRTDTGVHALQNFFHFDYELEMHPQFLYKMNAVLPADIVLKSYYQMPAAAHSRFDAIGREYEYRIYRKKNPFLKETAFYYPYKLDFAIMQEAAALVKEQSGFYAFAKTNTQVNNYKCTIYISEWRQEQDLLIYQVKANRFLRGMVRLLTATMLKLGRGKLTIQEFEGFFKSEVIKCSSSVPPTGLFLIGVQYPENFFPKQAYVSQVFSK